MSSQQIALGRNRSRPQQSRFQRLWSEAESLAAENAALEKNLDALVKRVDREVLSAERTMGETIREFVYQQIRFAGKKSLLKWQRAELNDWIDENLSELMVMGLLDEPLQNELARLRAFELGIEIDPDSDLSPAEQLDRYFGVDEPELDYSPDADGKSHRADAEQGDLFDDELDDTLDETLDEEFDDSLEDDEALAELLRKLREEFEGYQSIPPTADPDDTINPLSDEIFKRLFRQTAAALHPDRESDVSRQRDKHELMARLLKARKERDLITLLTLHEQHAAALSALSAEDEQALEQFLVDYLNQQQERADDIIMQSPMHRMAYAEFYSSHPATVTRKINAHLKQVEKRRLSLHRFMQETTTLKRLKDALAARYDAHSFFG